MKKLLALLGGTALAAAVIPYAYKKNEETDEKTIQALLWKATINDNPEDGQQKVALSVGFNNPFQSTEADLFADDLTVNYHTAPTCGCECSCEDECPCDGECDEDCPCDADCAYECGSEDDAVTDCCGECACGEDGEASCCCQETESVVEEVVEAVEEAAETVEETVEEVTE